MKRLFAAVAGLVLAGSAIPTHALAKDPPAKTVLAAIAPGLVRVEMDLQFDKGEPPTGVTDQDPGSRSHPVHSLAEVVEEERPLETTGFLIAPDLVVAMDATIHPRFVRAINVRVAGDETTATVDGYARDHWAVYLRLARPLKGTKPLAFGTGQAARVATYYRLEGGMVRELSPFGGRIQQAEDGRAWRVLDNQGVILSAAGQPLSVALGRRLPLDDSWQGSPGKWARVGTAEYQASLGRLGDAARRGLVRARLSFRSPKATPGEPRRRFRPEPDEDGDGEAATERDVIGVVLSGNRVAVLAALRPVTTGRLQRIVIHPAQGAPIEARFVASLKELGAFVVEPSKPLSGVPVASKPLSGLLEHLLYRADVALQGETRVEYDHHARIASLRVGPRLEPYPELTDPSDVARAFLFTPELELAALPIMPRERAGHRAPRFGGGSTPELTAADLLARAVARVPASADPANIPVSEADENRLAWLGVELQPMTRELARANAVAEQTQDGETGAIVSFVHPGSPAAMAGIGPGAVLLRLRAPGEPLPIEVRLEEDSARSQPFPWDRLDEIREQFFDRLPTPWAPVENAFTRALTDLGFGRRFALEYIADGKLASLEFTVAPSPAHYESSPRFKSEDLGITVRDLTYEVRRYLQRAADQPGVVVSKVERGSKASVAGVKPFELVTHVNDQPVMSVKDFEKLAAAGGELRLGVKRMAKGRIVTIKTDK